MRSSSWTVVLGMLAVLSRCALGADMCWKSSYGRGVGIIPDACPAVRTCMLCLATTTKDMIQCLLFAQGYELIGLLCYP